MSYIGLYSIVAVGLVMLTGVGGMTSFRPSRVCGHWRLRHRLGLHLASGGAGTQRPGGMGGLPWVGWRWAWC